MSTEKVPVPYLQKCQGPLKLSAETDTEQGLFEVE